jgi:alkylation response protein AidB-like acyl-CoA dehydrogenase
VLATGADALALHEQCDALTTAFTTIELAGMMQRVLELTTEYITGRIQFGQPIAKFQAARHRASELLMSTDMTRWAGYHAIWRFQEDSADTEEIWLAKHYAARAADPVYQHSHMLHGGVGVGTEYPLHLLTQGIIALAVRGGSLNELTERAIQSRDLEHEEQAEHGEQAS